MSRTTCQIIAPLRERLPSMPQKQSVIFVDVDDTLIRTFGTKQIPIPNAIRYVRDMFNAGNSLYCWSRGGAQYSRDVATKLGIADCFVCFLPKPDVVVDDRLEQLLDHCEFIHPNNAVTKPDQDSLGATGLSAQWGKNRGSA